MGEHHSTSSARVAVAVAGALGLAVLCWAAAVLLVEEARLGARAPWAQAGVEAAGACARMFGALALYLCAWGNAGPAGKRLSWVAAGLLVLGLGNLSFGYAGHLLGLGRDANSAAYGAMCTWTAAGALFAAGLAPARARELGWRGTLGALVAFGGLALVSQAASRILPPLVASSEHGWLPYTVGSFPGTTVWYLVFSAAPLGLVASAVVGAARGLWREGTPAWLPAAMVLLAGAQLHNLFVPSVYGPVLTSADLLRSASAGLVVAGGISELARIASERAKLLGAERERVRRLGELAALKADFTAMVAHELGGPLAAVRRFADLLDHGGADDPNLRAYAVGAIREQADALKNLVADVREAASAERDDFRVEPRPVKLRVILEDARSFADSLPGAHPIGALVSPEGTEEEEVLADPVRVGQVLRNLISNASKHSPEGVPIELRVTSGDREGKRCRVLIEVTDNGAGIHPDDLDRVFEKFGRGRNAEGGKVEGVGLGLYLSRRIVMAHGSELTVRSALGEGSIFSFELELLDAGKGCKKTDEGDRA